METPIQWLNNVSTFMDGGCSGVLQSEPATFPLEENEFGLRIIEWGEEFSPLRFCGIPGQTMVRFTFYELLSTGRIPVLSFEEAFSDILVRVTSLFCFFLYGI